VSGIWVERPTLDGLHEIHIGTAVLHLGIEFTEIGDDWLAGRMPVDQRTVQPYGILHGGASVLLAETLGSSGAVHCVDQTRFICVGQEINANHLRPAATGWVTGVARPVHLGRRSQVWNTELRDEAGRITCVSRITMAVLPKPDAGASASQA
jgi:1,4-dihydroxy-2-naphthoyl-CoA hydrolase